MLCLGCVGTGDARWIRGAIICQRERCKYPLFGEESMLKCEQAEEVAARTKELLETRGWCLWGCATLRDEVIAVARDERVEGVPQGVPMYTEAEQRKLFGNKLVTQASLRLIHEAKKQGTVITVPACWRGARCQK